MIKAWQKRKLYLLVLHPARINRKIFFINSFQPPSHHTIYNIVHRYNVATSIHIYEPFHVIIICRPYLYSLIPIKNRDKTTYDMKIFCTKHIVFYSLPKIIPFHNTAINTIYRIESRVISPWFYDDTTHTINRYEEPKFHLNFRVFTYIFITFDFCSSTRWIWMNVMG